MSRKPSWSRKPSKSHNVSRTHPCVDAVMCPYCYAECGKRCYAMKGVAGVMDYPAGHTHVARLKAWQAFAESGQP